MDFTQQQKSPGRQALGFGIVVLLHVGLIYALVTGLATNVVEVIKAPIETKIIEETKPPPPDVPPPPPPPSLVAPPPPYIPPPEIQIAQPPPPTAPPVAQVAHVAPPAPTAPVAVNAPPAPPAPSVPDSEVSARPISGGAPKYPPRMLDQGREGHVEVTCDVEADGSTSNCSVTSVTGGQAFADSALEYVKGARYKPRIRNGAAVREPHHTFSIAFTLK